VFESWYVLVNVCLTPTCTHMPVNKNIFLPVCRHCDDAHCREEGWYSHAELQESSGGAPPSPRELGGLLAACSFIMPMVSGVMQTPYT